MQKNKPESFKPLKASQSFQYLKFSFSEKATKIWSYLSQGLDITK